VTGWLAAFSP